MKLATLQPRVRSVSLSPIQPTSKAHGYDGVRGNSTQRGYTYRWQQTRKRYLMKHPLCVECEKDDLVVPATDVDHKIPHRGDPLLFWDETNWQGLCGPHHSAKTARGE